MKKTGKKIINNKDVDLKLGYGKSILSNKKIGKNKNTYTILDTKVYKRFAFTLDRDPEIVVLDWFKPLKKTVNVIIEDKKVKIVKKSKKIKTSKIDKITVKKSKYIR